MKFIRLFLLPFSIIYGLVTWFRNFFYDKNILKSYQFKTPVICVGNLNVGGTGKTPQIEYLINLLSENYKIATLSRGYKRKTKGFVLANKNSNAEILGDEPYQFYSKFKNILVAVDEDRKSGIENLLSLKNKPDIILLDDAFQHRKIHASTYILLTAFDDLYCDDFILPAGNLRESCNGAKRANIIIVTKCPKNLSKADRNLIEAKLNLMPYQKLFFTFIDYETAIYNDHKHIKVENIIDNEKLLIAGIAKPKPFFEYLKSDKNIILEFADHYNFKRKDIEHFKILSQNKIIITTEKDYARLKDNFKENLYYLPIKCSFIDNQNVFNNLIIQNISKYI